MSTTNTQLLIGTNPKLSDNMHLRCMASLSNRHCSLRLCTSRHWCPSSAQNANTHKQKPVSVGEETRHKPTKRRQFKKKEQYTTQKRMGEQTADGWQGMEFSNQLSWSGSGYLGCAVAMVFSHYTITLGAWTVMMVKG